MAKETYYFSHDSNARNDEKIVAVRMKYGAEGYGIYFMLLERIMESSNYMSVKDYNIIAFDLRVDASKVKSIIEDFGLFVFTEDGKYFYSESFNRRMVPLDNSREQRRLAGKKSAEKRAQRASKSAIVERPLNDRCQKLQRNSTKDSKMSENDKKTSDSAIFSTTVPTTVEKTVNDRCLKIQQSKGKEKEKKETTIVVSKKDSAAAIAATQTRAKVFGETLIPFMELYGKDMIRAFYDYWTEPNKSQTKMRFELERTWEVGRRLATWSKNEQFKSKNNGKDKYEQKRINSEQRKLESLANVDIIRAAAEKRRKELEADGIIAGLPRPTGSVD